MRGKTTNLKTISILAVLLSLAVISIQIYSKNIKHKKSIVYADLYNLNYYEYNGDGEYSKIVHAKKAVKEQNNYILDNINLATIEDKNSQELVATQAKLDTKNNLIHLKDNIIIKENINKKETIIKTNNLTINLDKKYAFNNSETTLINEQGTVNSIGIKIDLISKVFDLLSSISGEFNPNSHKK